jgi:hypothetical protein
MVRFDECEELFQILHESVKCVLCGSFENPARLLMRMCAELYSFYEKIDTNTVLYSNIFRSIRKNVKNFFNSLSCCGN